MYPSQMLLTHTVDVYHLVQQLEQLLRMGGTHESASCNLQYVLYVLADYPT